MHFVAQCPKLLQYRKDFLNNLLKLFPADDVADRFLIQNSFHDNQKILNLVLAGDCGFLKVMPENIHSIINSFLKQIYVTRCKLIFFPMSSDDHATAKATANKAFFSPLNRNVGSGVNDYVMTKS